MAERTQPRILQKLEARRESYKEKGRIYRAAWVLAGVIVVLAGIAMIVFPGPAVVVIPLGLAMLSFEFAWAQRLLDRGVDGGLEVKERIVAADRRSQVLGGIAVLAAVAAVVAVAVAVLL
ncbi:PGPGW domain-containing protein [Patulibacter minatonensis]|uniref:PGPGW domain-containing protein n=1 Tax=Patulibacter minatonensis TaxID=298163 RepID=UPI0004B738A3|nr:PGPGW domain-containing protein [Patulibacter minatonensis]